MKKVVILQHRLLHYRMGFFNDLRTECCTKGIDLYLVHGQPTASEAKKQDIGHLPWADAVINRYVSVFGRDILWQPFPKKHKDADLIVIMQENRLISNYPWLLMRFKRKPKVAYWGHGRNFQADRPRGLLERWKQFLVSHVDWWFAYTEMTRQILLSDGFSGERITVLDNAIDNERFTVDLEAVSDFHLKKVREELGLQEGAVVGLFCGSLYPDKRLDFLIRAADKIRGSIPSFHLLIIGDGSSANEIRDAVMSRSWMHWLGVRKGVEKAAYFRLSQIVLNPGLVGLHVLDSFCAGTPMITTSDARHSPEIAYLRNNENGLVVDGGVDVYADAVVDLIRDTGRYSKLQENALEDAHRYTLKNMVKNFSEGIERCLAL